MARKGFTLIELLISLLILSIVSLTVLSSLSFSYQRFGAQKRKAEMIFLGESVVEKIKACQGNDPDCYIFDQRLCDLIDLFRSSDSISISFPDSDNRLGYLIDLDKINRAGLWQLTVRVSEKGEGENKRQITYQAFLPAK